MIVMIWQTQLFVVNDLFFSVKKETLRTEMAAMLLFWTNLVGVELFSYVNSFYFYSNKFAFLLVLTSCYYSCDNNFVATMCRVAMRTQREFFM